MKFKEIPQKMENYRDHIANYRSGVANCFNSKCLDDVRVTPDGHDGVKK